MSEEDAMFKMADALMGVLMETGNIDRYISKEDFDACMDTCRETNPERYDKEIAIFF